MAWVLAFAVIVVGCGKKGPPLPPIIRLPAAPVDLVAARRGMAVEVQFTVPLTNTDKTEPANVDRIDVYAVDDVPTISDADLIARGTRIASVDVKSPLDPDTLLDPDDPESRQKLLEPTGLDQGATARVVETLPPSRDPAAASGDLRVYAAVAVNNRGRTGPFSVRVSVPLEPAPEPPAALALTYDERGVTVTWKDNASGEAPAGYFVYERPLPPEDPSPDQPAPADVRLTPKPITNQQFLDARIEWGAERCYVVRSIRQVDGFPLESEAPRPNCVTPVDTFAPPPPTGLAAMAASVGGSINLMWDRMAVSDLAGYLVLRAPAQGGTPQVITPSPLETPNFSDSVQPGVRYIYTIQAVDTSGNRSKSSTPVEESAR